MSSAGFGDGKEHIKQLKYLIRIVKKFDLDLRKLDQLDYFLGRVQEHVEGLYNYAR